MEQNLESYQPTSGALSVLRRLIGFQLACQALIIVDQFIRYVVRSKKPRDGTTIDRVTFGWDDGFALFALASLLSAACRLKLTR